MGAPPPRFAAMAALYSAARQPRRKVLCRARPHGASRRPWRSSGALLHIFGGFAFSRIAVVSISEVSSTLDVTFAAKAFSAVSFHVPGFTHIKPFSAVSLSLI